MILLQNLIELFQFVHKVKQTKQANKDGADQEDKYDTRVDTLNTKD